MRFRNRNTPGQNRLSASREPEFQDTQDSDPVRGPGEGVAPKRMARGPQPTWSEYPVNLEVLNRYVLAAIGLFAFCLSIAILAIGFSELRSRLPKIGTRKKRSRNQSATRRWRPAKRSQHPYR